MKCRSYCFTSFKSSLEPDMERVRYIVWGEEVCPSTGRNHLQGYVEFFAPQRIAAAKDYIGDEKAHFEGRRGSREEARDYCMKDGKVTVMGDWGKGGQGARNDLYAIMDDIKEGKSDFEICEAQPDKFERFSQFIRKYRDMWNEEKSKLYLKKTFGDVVLNEHQTKIMELLNAQTERQVLWVHDEKGGTGKTFLSKHLLAQGDCFRCTNGKTKDIAYAYNGEGTFVMDLSRSIEGHVNYDIIEQIKNGLIFSAKYESKHKVFVPPKILILSNFGPTLSALSEDRWVVEVL